MLNKDIWIPSKVVLKVAIDRKTVVVQVMACRQTGDKPLPEPLMTKLTDACMRQQWPILLRKLTQVQLLV